MTKWKELLQYGLRVTIDEQIEISAGKPNQIGKFHPFYSRLEVLGYDIVFQEKKRLKILPG